MGSRSLQGRNQVNGTPTPAPQSQATGRAKGGANGGSQTQSLGARACRNSGGRSDFGGQKVQGGPGRLDGRTHDVAPGASRGHDDGHGRGAGSGRTRLQKDMRSMAIDKTLKAL